MADDSQNKNTGARIRLHHSNLETAVDKQIREAIERGDFDHLRNQGKPLNLARDPNVPQEWEMAYHLLKNAGFAPDWIETRKEVDAARETLFAPLTRFLQNPPRDEKAYTQQQIKCVQDFRARAQDLNHLIDTYNLKAPAPQVHLHRVRIEYEIEKFLARGKK